MTEQKKPKATKKIADAGKSPQQKLKEQIEGEGIEPAKAAMVVMGNAVTEAKNRAESAKKEIVNPADDFIYFDSGSAKILSGMIPEDKKQFSYEDFLEELCSYGLLVGFQFRTLDDLKIMCGTGAYMIFKDLPEFSSTLSNCNQSRGSGWFQINNQVR